ncbi:MAG TPA: glycosyltransferase family 4 protein [Acidimicrobiales bacterium]|nr:glycosyltransferase family 4 protein [Acidimicrobiales bacterium]
MRIGIVKPDFGIVGGFELVLQRISRELAAMGHSVEWLTVDVRHVRERAFGIDIPDYVWHSQAESFRYLALVDAFSVMRLDAVDLVLSTQPPSYAVHHPRHLALFSHHQRMYYDLSNVWIEAGFAPDVALHHEAKQLIRSLDYELLRRPGHILAASEVVKERLDRFNGLRETVGVYHAGVGVGACEVPVTGQGKHAICVSRQEFPKRTELFVHAMKLLPDLKGVAVGGGTRLQYVQSLDAKLSAMGSDIAHVDSLPMWLCRHDDRATGDPPVGSNVEYLGHVDDSELSRLYAEAFCVVAPAYDEDYGLTAIEAMQHGKPLVVCRDGGGLTLFVEDGVNGLVVEPTGPAIAAAVQRLREEPGLAEALGEGARATAATYTWHRAMREINEGIERVCSN